MSKTAEPGTVQIRIMTDSEMIETISDVFKDTLAEHGFKTISVVTLMVPEDIALKRCFIVAIPKSGQSIIPIPGYSQGGKDGCD